MVLLVLGVGWPQATNSCIRSIKLRINLFKFTGALLMIDQNKGVLN